MNNLRFVAFLNNLRLGSYSHRENAGRRILAVRRNMKGGWKRVRDGVWQNRKDSSIRLYVRQERVRA